MTEVERKPDWRFKWFSLFSTFDGIPNAVDEVTSPLLNPDELLLPLRHFCLTREVNHSRSAATEAREVGLKLLWEQNNAIQRGIKSIPS